MKKRLQRRHYSPLANPIRTAIKRASSANLDPLVMRIQEQDALNGIYAGKPTPLNVLVMTALEYVTRTLALRGIGPEAIPICNACRHALLRLQQGPTKLHPENFAELLAYSEAQRVAAPDEWLKAMIPFVKT